MIDFCFDIILSKNVPWPNGISAEHTTVDTLWNERGTWSNREPWIDYPRILDYLRDEKVDYQCHLVEQAPLGSLYPININWFDHSFDYFTAISEQALQMLQQGFINLVFFYSEADNPLLIQKRLFDLCKRHLVSPVRVHFVIANTAAELLPNFYYLDDDEIIFQRSQKNHQRLLWNNNAKTKTMTLLSRIHKTWRAEFCARYWHHQLHLSSFFSYHHVSFEPDQSPLRNQNHKLTQEFLQHCPFEADDLTDQQRNFYGTRVDEFFAQSYWNCVLETHINFENNIPGVFISEKTWKPIANAQPFVVLGCYQTLRHLQNQGYQTFGAWIDEEYDNILDPTERFETLWQTVRYIHNLNNQQLWDLHVAMKDTVVHNQQLYWQSKQGKLVDLFEQITNAR